MISEKIIRNESLLRRSKIYSWEQIKKHTPRGIAPTDIEGAYEVNRHFLFLEFKTEGVEMPLGQRLFYRRLLEALSGSGMVFVCEHAGLGLRTVPLGDTTTVCAWSMNFETRKVPTKDTDLGWLISEWAAWAEKRESQFFHWLMENRQ